MRNIVKKIGLEGLSFILQFFIGFITNWVISPVIVATQNLFVATLFIFFLFLIKLVFLIRVFDYLEIRLGEKPIRGIRKNLKNNYRNAKRLLRYGYRFFGVVAITGNNFYGMRLVRRKKRGIPRSTWYTIFWGICLSAIILVLTQKGFFSIWPFILKVVELFLKSTPEIIL